MNIVTGGSLAGYGSFPDQHHDEPRPCYKNVVVILEVELPVID